MHLDQDAPKILNYDLLFSDSSAIVSKSCTHEKREGNEKPRYYHNKFLSINSMGMPNNGYKFYIDMIDKINNNKTKPYIISVAGLN
jgi:dihydroorotate dehydrogenase (fumarate)